MSRIRILMLIAAAALVPFAMAAPASAVGPTPPRIVANPSMNLVPGQVIALRGTGFQPATTYTIKECSQTNWVVTANPCNTNNVKRVRTNAVGAFRTPFTAEVCPAPSATPAPPVVRCFVGVPKPYGVDTVKLVGAAQITVQAVP